MKSFKLFDKLFGKTETVAEVKEPAFVPQEPAIEPVKEVKEEPRKPTFMDHLLGKQAFYRNLGKEERIAKAATKRERKMRRNLELVRLGGLKAVA